MALIQQEVATERYVDIPGGVLDDRIWRPLTPGAGPEAGEAAGQWGTALALATAQYGMECEVV
jgi:predicted alternative tryptophan synthase beta-subunit